MMNVNEPIRSVQRAVSLLTVLNLKNSLTLTELADETGLPKTTVFRLLDTLEHEGLITKDPGGKGYTVARGALRLSSGYVEEPIFEHARHQADEITKLTKWPCVIATPAGADMEILYSTHLNTPMVMWLGSLKRKLPMLEWAVGQTYLAFSRTAVRESHFDYIEHQYRAPYKKPINRRDWHAKLDQFRVQGYGFRPSSLQLASSSIGVPIFDEGEVVGSIVLNFFGNALSEISAAQRYVSLLRSASP